MSLLYSLLSSAKINENTDEECNIKVEIDDEVLSNNLIEDHNLTGEIDIKEEPLPEEQEQDYEFVGVDNFKTEPVDADFIQGCDNEVDPLALDQNDMAVTPEAPTVTPETPEVPVKTYKRQRSKNTKQVKPIESPIVTSAISKNDTQVTPETPEAPETPKVPVKMKIKRQRSKNVNQVKPIKPPIITSAINDTQVTPETPKEPIKKIKKKRIKSIKQAKLINPPIPTSVIPKNDKRTKVYQKKSYCFYCEAGYTKVLRHLLNAHKNEKEVKEIRKLRLKSVERCNKIRELVQKGNFFHNAKVLKTGEGEMAIKKRSRFTQYASNFEPCLFCNTYLSANTISNHILKCKHRENNTMSTRHIRSICKSLKPITENIEEEFTELLSKLKPDESGNNARSDSLIIKFGKREFSCEKRPHVVRERMRELGRLLQALKTNFQIYNLEEVFDINKWDILASAISKSGNVVADKPLPGSVSKVKVYIQKCIGILIGEAILSEQIDRKNELIDLSAKIVNEWAFYFTTACVHDQEEEEDVVNSKQISMEMG